MSFWIFPDIAERVIEENKNHYYLTLRRAQATLDQGEGDLGAWISFFLRCLKRQKKALARKVELERRMEELPPLQAQLLALARDHRRLTIRSAVDATGANRNTVKTHLRRLVAAGRLRRRGQGRGSWYEPART